MPLFGHKSESNPPTYNTHDTRYNDNNNYNSTSSSKLHRNSTNSRSHRRSTNSGGLFNRNRRSSSVSSLSSHEARRTSSNPNGNKLTSLFHRNTNEDPSITAARQRVAAAEQAERDADAALAQAKVAVREAKEHVRMLQKEAEEEEKRAKVKRSQIGDLEKRTKPLGRKFY